MTDLEITFEESSDGGRYLARLPGTEKPAELTFRRRAPHTLVVDYTYVPEAQRGHGIALKLTQRVIEDARAEGLKIIPQCPYVRAKAEQRPEWSDVIVR